MNDSKTELDNFNLMQIIEVIWQDKFKIIFATGLVAGIALFFVLRMPNIYQAEALLAPAEEVSGGGLSSLASQLGGLASLAGVKVGTSNEVDKVQLATEVMKSRAFVKFLIEKYDMMVPLMAADGWKRGEDKLTYDPEIYDEASGQWVRDVKPPFKPEPSHWEAYKAFKERVFNVSENPETGLYKVTINHYSPRVAKEWAEIIVSEINRYMRERDILNTEKSIDFLKQQIAETSVAEMQTVFYEIIEEQTKQNMLASTRDEYVFRVVDPAVEPEEKNKPKRGLILVVITMVAGIFFAALSLALSLFRVYKPS